MIISEVTDYYVNFALMVLLVLVISLVICPFCFAQEQGGAAQEVSGFSLTQYEEGGKKKWKMNGKSAEVEEKKVKIKEISAVAFGEETILKLKARQGDFDREENMVHLENDVVVKTTDGTMLTTDSLDWDAETRNVFTDNFVNIKKSDFHVNGKGAELDLEEKTAELKKDVVADIVTSAPDFLRTTNHPSTPLGTGESRTTITCDGPLEINYERNKATFLNNVKVEDSQGKILSDRIDVYFSPDTRRIRCVVARGNVRIVNGENVTYSEKAIYLVEQGRVILPKRPKLVIQSETSEKF